MSLSANSNRGQQVSDCARYLEGAVETEMDSAVIAAPFLHLAMEQLEQNNVDIDQASLVRIFFHWQLTSVPTSLDRPEETAFCFLQSDIGIRDFRSDEQGNTGFAGYTDRAQFREAYFVAAHEVPAALNKIASNQIGLMAPTITGQIKEPCGYFELDPESRCATIYRLHIRGLQSKRECAKSDKERADIDRQVEEFQEKLIGLPPEPPDSEYFTIKLNDRDHGCED